MNLIKETFINPKGDHHMHQWFNMPYICMIKTSLQAYRLFFERFLVPCLSLLNKIQQGGVDMLNVLKTLYEKGSFSCDCILTIDEMYLWKPAQYQSGEYVGEDEEGITVFMVVRLKQSIPFVVQAIPDVIFNEHWLVEKISDHIDNLMEFGLSCTKHTSYWQSFS